MKDLFKNLTEDELWGNFENDFSRRNESELFDRIKEICGEDGLRDYEAFTWAVEFTEYAEENVMTTSEIIFVKKYLDGMTNRKKIHPKQKQLAEKFIRKIYSDYFHLF
jgi:hypothetical protein